jgi:hypothetical protein
MPRLNRIYCVWFEKAIFSWPDLTEYSVCMIWKGYFSWPDLTEYTVCIIWKGYSSCPDLTKYSVCMIWKGYFSCPDLTEYTVCMIWKGYFSCPYLTEYTAYTHKQTRASPRDSNAVANRALGNNSLCPTDVLQLACSFRKHFCMSHNQCVRSIALVGSFIAHKWNKFSVTRTVRENQHAWHMWAIIYTLEPVGSISKQLQHYMSRGKNSIIQNT